MPPREEDSDSSGEEMDRRAHPVRRKPAAEEEEKEEDKAVEAEQDSVLGTTGEETNGQLRGEDAEIRRLVEAKFCELAPLRELARQRAASKPVRLPFKARPKDMPEAVFMGELVEAMGFEAYEGVSVYYRILWEEPWVLLDGEAVGQTQTAISSWVGKHAAAPLNSPIDLHFAAPSTIGWPKLMVVVRGTDPHGRVRIVGYGFAYLPALPGPASLDIHCWRPTGSMRDEVAAFFLGNTAHLTNDDVVCAKAAWTARCRLVTVPAGSVSVSVSVLLKNFGTYGIDGPFPHIQPAASS